ncbi:hypothetical protein PSAB6_50069 [Paraburkholderia sabiae]|nr:hypothetical protein PSAB6_50069 [Paraburkholderia sabiae]
MPASFEWRVRFSGATIRSDDSGGVSSTAVGFPRSPKFSICFDARNGQGCECIGPYASALSQRRVRSNLMQAFGLEEIIYFDAVCKICSGPAKKSIQSARCFANSFSGLPDN